MSVFTRKSWKTLVIKTCQSASSILTSDRDTDANGCGTFVVHGVVETKEFSNTKY